MNDLEGQGEEIQKPFEDGLNAREQFEIIGVGYPVKVLAPDEELKATRISDSITAHPIGVSVELKAEPVIDYAANMEKFLSGEKLKHPLAISPAITVVPMIVLVKLKEDSEPNQKPIEE